MSSQAIVKVNDFDYAPRNYGNSQKNLTCVRKYLGNKSPENKPHTLLYEMNVERFVGSCKRIIIIFLSAKMQAYAVKKRFLENKS